MSDLAITDQFEPSGYFSFRGRITRRSYWMHYTLPLLAAAIVASAIDYGLFGGDNLFTMVASIACLWPSLASISKRLHDRGRSAWFMLIAFVPLIGVFWLLIECGFLRGGSGANRFGPSPLERA